MFSSKFVFNKRHDVLSNRRLLMASTYSGAFSIIIFFKVFSQGRIAGTADQRCLFDYRCLFAKILFKLDNSYSSCCSSKSPVDVRP